MGPTRYRIVVRGRLTGTVGSAFREMRLTAVPGATELEGELTDQSQLYGVLLRIRDLGIELVSVNAVR